MGHPPLVEGQLSGGQGLLDALASTPLDVDLAFWFYSADSERWTLYIASAFMERNGPLASYKIVLEAADTLPPSPWFDPMNDVRVAAPGDPTVRAVRSAYEPYPPWPVARRVQGGYESGVHLVDSYVYPRRAPTMAPIPA